MEYGIPKQTENSEVIKPVPGLSAPVVQDYRFTCAKIKLCCQKCDLECLLHHPYSTPKSPAPTLTIKTQCRPCVGAVLVGEGGFLPARIPADGGQFRLNTGFSYVFHNKSFLWVE